MLGWCFTYTLAMSFAKLLSDQLSLVTIIFMRTLFGFTLFIPFIFRGGTKYFSTKKQHLHILRIILTSCSMYCTYYAYTNLPLSIATAIGFTSPLIITLLAMIILNEKVTIKQWLIVIVGYIGVLIMVQPSGLTLSLAFMSAILANVFAGSAIITVKKLTETESEKTIMLYTNTFVLVVMSFLVTFDWTEPSLSDVGYLILMGGSGMLSQFCYVKALKLGNPAYLAPFEYSRLLFAVPIGLYIFNEHITLGVLFGALLIIISNYLIRNVYQVKLI